MWSNFSCRLTSIHASLALSFMKTSERWLVWWRNTRKTSASSTWTGTCDVFCYAHAARFTNTSQVLVYGDDADVFIPLFHHTHCLCDVVIELNVSGRNNWRCINISELARKIGQQVSEISLFAVLWFWIDQRLLITTTVPISISRMSSSGYLSRLHWLWLYNSNSLSSGLWVKRIIYICFTRLSEMELIQDSIHCKVEKCTCMLYSRKDIRVNDAYPQRKDPDCCNMWRNLIQSPYHHDRLWWIKTPASQSHGPYMEVCLFGQLHLLETSWAWMEIFPLCLTVFDEDDGSPYWGQWHTCM